MMKGFRSACVSIGFDGNQCLCRRTKMTKGPQFLTDFVPCKPCNHPMSLVQLYFTMADKSKSVDGADHEYMHGG